MTAICRSTTTDCVTSTPTDFIDASMAELTDDLGVFQFPRPLAEPAHVVINLTNFVERELGLRWAYTLKSGKVQTRIYRF